jgi:hypothetical protein
VPTSVEAGEGTRAASWATSPMPLVLVIGGLVLVGTAVAARLRRHGADGA